jgi:interleukin-1 receptor-associated kinase 1/coatomer subunit beta'
VIIGLKQTRFAILTLAPADELRGLEWHTRFEIIKGICNGLHHLHNEKGIIHMDLKPLNILLDDNMVPKITDFGISRAGDITKTISQERVCSL